MPASQPSEKLTGSIAEASKVLNIGINQTYEAAHQGAIPTMRIGKRLVVLWKPFLAKLNGDA